MPLNPRRGMRAARTVALIAALMALAAAPAWALRVTTWNLLNYPGLGLSTRQPFFRTVMGSLDTDVLIVQELTSIAGRDSFLANVLNVVNPGEWAVSGFVASTESAVYYKTTKVTISGVIARATTGPRDILECTLRPVGYLSDSAKFRVYSVHYKAGTSCSPLPCDSTVRRQECTDLRQAYLNALPFNSHFLVGGDTNFYGAFEPGYIRLLEDQSDNDGRCRDPLNMPGNWNNNSGYALHDTQCPCVTPGTDCLGGFSGGGMDDRFDLWMSSISLRNGEGLDMLLGFTNYIPYGNDGQHFNMNLDAGGFNNAVGVTVAAALRQASDHLPVIATLQLPALSSAPGPIAFGNVIVGAVAELPLPVSNLAVTPADDLDYSLAAPAGFTCPAGPFSALPGAAASNHTVTLDTSAPATLAGNLVMTSDDFENPTRNVALSGTVLAHSDPSLDSAVVLLGQDVDFGEHDEGDFTDQSVRVWNHDYDPLQAQLRLTAGNVTGGDGRFSIVGGFTLVQLAGTPAEFALRFDDAGATTDSTYTATLTFSAADEVLPGATAQSDLVVTLAARVSASGVGIEEPGLPAYTQLLPARPNPAPGRSTLRFDLAQRGRVSLDLFDLRGRHVRGIVQGELDPGRHHYGWDGTAEDGSALPAGIYFLRFQAVGMKAVTSRVVLLR